MDDRQNIKQGREVYIVDGLRTPFLKARGKRGLFSASDLAVQAGRSLIERNNIEPEDINEVVLGCAMPSAQEANIARVVGLRLKCGDSVPAFTVQRNCASGMQSLDNAAQDISFGRHELVLAGGTEAMSRAPLFYNNSMTEWLANFSMAKTFSGKIGAALQFRPRYLAPVIALLQGLTDHTVNLSMGQTAEILAWKFNITREDMDRYSLDSQQRTAHAQDEHYFDDEVQATIADTGALFELDDGVRRDTTMAKLAQLKPFFDKKFGSVTAGNSSQVTDGSCMLLLASKDAVQKYDLPVLARIVDCAWAGVDPSQMGLGPVHATDALLKRHNMGFKDIDYWELNEAFAGQVIACLEAWQSDTYCREKLGRSVAWGEIDRDRLNVDGGAIALGHPVGASGARITLHLVQVLKRLNAQRGVATICIGGGQGGAMLIENVSGV